VRLAALAVSLALVAFAIAFAAGHAGRPETALAGHEPALTQLPAAAAVPALPEPATVAALPAIRVRHVQKHSTTSDTTGSSTSDPTSTGAASQSSTGAGTGSTGSTGSTGGTQTPSHKTTPSTGGAKKTPSTDGTSTTGDSLGG
jgi:hypothetical protein